VRWTAESYDRQRRELGRLREAEARLSATRIDNHRVCAELGARIVDCRDTIRRRKAAMGERGAQSTARTVGKGAAVAAGANALAASLGLPSLPTTARHLSYLELL